MQAIKFVHDMKTNKHNQIVNDYDKIKSSHLERLAAKILKDEEK